MSIKRDIDRSVNSFPSQFNMMYSESYFINRNMICYLYKSFTSSFYGVELWTNRLEKLNAVQGVSVAYHKAVKNNRWIKCLGQQPCCMRYG